ncbi:MAG: exo-beta-N-acetylmuramidase NamZ family protein [Candidatus Tyrphobacter sp.]
MRRAPFIGSIAATLAASALPAAVRASSDAPLLGDDLLARHRAELASASVGIITNQTGVNSAGVGVVDAARAAGLRVRALFSPEHGLHGDRPAGAFVESYTDERTGLPVYSLYGPDRHPSSKMLAGLDVLLFDIQDVGSRAYTFISTMAMAMQSAAAHGIEFWVLDRPNPVGGAIVEGPVLQAQFSSFIGLYPIAMRHGMTVGELAGLFNAHFGIGARLRVVAMEGWKRSTIWPQTHLRWIRTSPNVPTWQTSFVYLCTGLIDSLGLNNGVGTPEPFFYAGAPHLDARAFASALSERQISGVEFVPSDWSPSKGANAGRSFSGVRLDLFDPADFFAVRTAVELLVCARTLEPSAISTENVRAIDLDWGTDSVRAQLLSGRSADEIVASWQGGLSQFLPLRERFLLYS